MASSTLTYLVGFAEKVFLGREEGVGSHESPEVVVIIVP